MSRHWFRELLTGKNGPLLSDAEYKTAVLRGNLALVAITVSISYLFIDYFNRIDGNQYYYVATFFFALVSVYLNRQGHYRWASVLFISTLIFIVFLFASGDTYRSGVYIFFVITSLTSFALFGFKERKLALLFTGVSLGLFLYAYWVHPDIVPKRTFTEAYLNINFTTNFIVALVTAIAIVYFLIEVNYNSEKVILHRNEQLAKANSELDRFVYSASHDLRAPLSSILGLVQVYQMSGSSDERNQVVGLIKDRVNKLDHFISEILDYSRNSRLQIRKTVVNGTLLAKEIIEGLRYTRGFEGVKIYLDNAEVLLVTDPERLKVILNNLIANALKYHDPAKDEPFVKIRFHKNHDAWHVEIEDNGQGIQEAHQIRIFEMFYRAHENSEGSGLGLYIVKEVAERMGGNVAIKSEFRKGSLFTVSFPEG
jgi:signal transduction histidine kinase